jgi:hypothetical protein
MGGMLYRKSQAESSSNGNKDIFTFEKNGEKLVPLTSTFTTDSYLAFNTVNIIGASLAEKNKTKPSQTQNKNIKENNRDQTTDFHNGIKWVLGKR